MEFTTLTRSEWTLLEECFLFREVERSVVEGCLSDPRCTRMSANRGEEIYTPHTFQRNLGILLSGRIQVWKEQLLVSELERGALFGAAALFQEGTDYVTTLVVQTDCEFLFLPEPLVEELLRSPQATRNYVRYLSGRVRFLSGKLDELLVGSAERKLALYLLDQMEDGNVTMEGSMTALAKRLHVSRASLYRAFDTLSASGAIEKHGKLVCILDCSLLQTV